jgi:hypothetical protein
MTYVGMCISDGNILYLADKGINNSIKVKEIGNGIIVGMAGIMFGNNFPTELSDLASCENSDERIQEFYNTLDKKSFLFCRQYLIGVMMQQGPVIYQFDNQESGTPPTKVISGYITGNNNINTAIQDLMAKSQDEINPWSRLYIGYNLAKSLNPNESFPIKGKLAGILFSNKKHKKYLK